MLSESRELECLSLEEWVWQPDDSRTLPLPEQVGRKQARYIFNLSGDPRGGPTPTVSDLDSLQGHKVQDFIFPKLTEKDKLKSTTFSSVECGN